MDTMNRRPMEEFTRKISTMEECVLLFFEVEKRRNADEK
jgi:hypothetical protein